MGDVELLHGFAGLVVHGVVAGLDVGGHVGSGDNALEIAQGVGQGRAGDHVHASGFGLIGGVELQFGDGLAGHEAE